ncbi:DUF6745 domain-containing protein [Deinococcus maricopensis]|uniref:DUF6745 domain-containing protein n=1 Tax=Deinococcus maricopensis (strain DSM 21211 / LMG 22137 / NRRL B-23946 / LB-34) TaxID=709986 RepID=E8U323_DEIML|nr:hypothetical protein [Deinococcus maricopensis]ADV65761.1 hypothetical protein Deima_0097 [Deinococcus maricopensis DSM 21211]
MSALALGAKVLSATEARERLLSGDTTSPLYFRGHLDLSGTPLTRLPDDLSGDTLDLSDTGLPTLPERLNVGELLARNLPITHVPASTRVLFRLTLDGCPRLQHLPEGLKVGSLSLQDCPSLEHLPEGLDVCFLNISRCDALRTWPERAQVRHGHLIARDCLNLRALPAWLTHVAQLDLSGCRGITALPEGLRINGWLDVADSGLTGLPEGQDVPLRWRGVRIDAHVAFHPERITAAEVLAQPNAEVRRVMMERMGAERFLQEAGAEELDRDHDAGGERRLLRVNLPNDEPFVAVSVACPSTGRAYVLRVPPTIRTAHAASAWLAGFDDPALYQPALEA